MNEIRFDVMLYPVVGKRRRVSMGKFGWRDSLVEQPLAAIALVPFDSEEPVVLVHLPEGVVAEAIMRVKARIGGVDLRVHGVGYDDVMAWVLPDGRVEVGPDSLMADVLLDEVNA